MLCKMPPVAPFGPYLGANRARGDEREGRVQLSRLSGKSDFTWARLPNETELKELSSCEKG
jgi:hypothetical protein